MNNKKLSIIQTERDIYQNYQEFYQFMGQFMVDADFDKFDEVATIMEYNESCERDYKRYLKVKSQAEELMNMDPFPREAISWSAGGLDRDPEKVKKWLLKVLDLLEKRVTGKL